MGKKKQDLSAFVEKSALLLRKAAKTLIKNRLSIRTSDLSSVNKIEQLAKFLRTEVKKDKAPPSIEDF